FSPVSAPADSIFGLSLFVLAVTAVIFVTVFGLLVYSAVRFRKRADDDGREPAQVYGSNQLELAWTVIPVLIVGGPIIAGETLSRFFALHVFVTPGMLIGLVGLHLLMVLKLGINEWPMPGRLVRRETYLWVCATFV